MLDSIKFFVDRVLFSISAAFLPSVLPRSGPLSNAISGSSPDELAGSTVGALATHVRHLLL